jgi:hypothetical protein
LLSFYLLCSPRTSISIRTFTTIPETTRRTNQLKVYKEGIAIYIITIQFTKIQCGKNAENHSIIAGKRRTGEPENTTQQTLMSSQTEFM